MRTGRIGREVGAGHRLAKLMERLRKRLITLAGFDLNAPGSEVILMATAMYNEMFVKQLREIKQKIDAEVAASLAKLKPETDKLDREKARVQALSETFGRYAKEKSECPSKASGGVVGPFPKVGFMVAAFSNAAFALQPYQMSDVVQTPFGYHLILCVEHKAGREVKFEDVKEVVKEVYFDRLHESLSTQLRAQAKIVVNPPPKQ